MMRILADTALVGLLLLSIGCASSAPKSQERGVSSVNEWPLFVCKRGVETQAGPFAEKALEFYSSDRVNYVVKFGVLNMNDGVGALVVKHLENMTRSTGGPEMAFNGKDGLTIILTKEDGKVRARMNRSIFVLDSAFQRSETAGDKRWGFFCAGPNLPGEF